MGFFDKIFGRKRPVDPAQKAPTAPTPAPTNEPATAPMIDLVDAYGRHVQFTREQWRTEVLPHSLRRVWDQPEALAQMIIQSLHDGFFAEVLPAAERLSQIDSDPERAACVLGSIYLKLERFAEAENALSDYVARHGETGPILINLAKVYRAQNKPESHIEATLWRGLTLDPNQDTGLPWFVGMHNERAGPAGATDALRRVAALAGSWRAQCWLAREALERRELEVALALYHEVLARFPQPAPTAALQQISGDLVNHGHLPDALTLIAPLFQLEDHGISVGNNLLKANLDLGRIEATQALLDQLYAMKRPEWASQLAYWDNEIGRAKISIATPGKEQPPIAGLSLAGPIWLRRSSPAAELFPGKTDEAPTLSFYGASIEYPATQGQLQVQPTDTAGRLSRALPLFLAEQVHFFTEATGRVLQMWIPSLHGAFAVSSAPWSAADAAAEARAHTPPSDYAFILHLSAAAEPWSVELRLVRTIDARLLASKSIPFTSDAPGTFFKQLGDITLSLLQEHAELGTVPAPEGYTVPAGNSLSEYTGRLEQALAVAVAAMPEAKGGSLNREREIVSGMLQYCLVEPRSLAVRLLFVQTLTNLRKVRPQVVAEFQEKVALLQKEHPFPMPTQGVIQRMVDALFPPASQP